MTTINRMLLVFFLSLPNVEAGELWTPPPLPPLPHEVEPRPTDPVVIKYNNYAPGQIRLSEHRLKSLVEDLQWHIQESETNKTEIRRMEIHGFSDKLIIVDHDKIFYRIPGSIRPSFSHMINNKLIAEGRATYILENLRKGLGYRIPTKITVISHSELPIGGANRGIEVHILVTSNHGMKR